MSQKVTKMDISGMMVGILMFAVGLYCSANRIGIGRTSRSGEDILTGGFIILIGGIIIGALLENMSFRSK